MTPAARKVRQQLLVLSDAGTARTAARFFKPRSLPGDKFIGVRIPVMRKLVPEHRMLALKDVLSMLPANEHEVRVMAILLLVDRFKQGSTAEQRAVYQSYLGHTKYLNNWDFVDISAYHIVGPHLRERSRRPLYRLVKSQDMWERRIAIVATLAYIREHDFDDALALSELLLDDAEDLIHKPVGWMLREVGKRDLNTAEAFLKKHHRSMPRTALRYAIERFTIENKRKYMRTG